MTPPRVRVGIVSYRCVGSLLELLNEIKRQEPEWEVCVWDNQSESSLQIKQLIASSTWVNWTYFYPENCGFAKALNRIAELPGEWDVLITVNPDAKLLSRLAPLAEACKVPGVGAAGGRVMSVDNSTISNVYPELGPIGLALRTVVGNRFERPTRGKSEATSERISGWVEGSLLAFSHAAWVDVGPLDDRFFLYSEEQDWQRRAHLRGWSVVQVSGVSITHEAKGTTSGRHDLAQLSVRLQEVSRRLYIAKWWGRWGLFVYLAVRFTGLTAKKFRDKVFGSHS